VSNFAQSIAFYDKAFAPLGVTRLVNIPASADNNVEVAAYGDSRPWFWIAAADPTNGKLHIALNVESRSKVDEFYSAAMLAGAKDNGSPGIRSHYHPNYYGAFVLDPDGHNIEVVCHLPG